MNRPSLLQLSRRRWLQLGAASLAGAALGTRIASADTPAQAAAPVADPIRLNLNESSFGPSPRATAAIREAIVQAPRYVEAAQASALQAQIAAFEGVAPEQVVLGEVLEALGQHLAIAGGGGQFVLSVPGYGALVDAARPFGGTAVEVALDAKLANDLPGLLAAINHDTRALFVVNPHNPSGTLSPKAEFDRFMTRAAQQTLVIVDEAYLDYLDDFQQRTATRHLRNGANVVVFRTFGKIHALAGLQIGYALAPRALADALRARGVGGAHSLNQLSVAAASASLADTAHVASVRRRVAAERQRWLQLLEQWKRPYAQPAGNFVFFDAGRPAAQVRDALAAHGIRIGREFAPYANWVRITIGTPAENAAVQRALASILARKA